jgi:hypothetical protein
VDRGGAGARADGTLGGGAPGAPLGRSLGMPPANSPPRLGGPPGAGAVGAAGAPARGTAGAFAMPPPPPPPPLPPGTLPATAGADRSLVWASTQPGDD